MTSILSRWTMVTRPTRHGFFTSMFGAFILVHPLLGQTNHDRFHDALHTRVLVEERKTQVIHATADLLAELKATVGTIQPDSLDGERRTLAALRLVVIQLRSEAAQVIEAHKRFTSSATKYASDLEKAGSVLEETATEFRGFAKNERIDEIATQYSLMADVFHAFGQKYRRIAREFIPANKTVQQNLHHVERSKLFLDRLAAAIELMPNDVTEVERLLALLQHYVDNFEQLRVLIQEFHKNVTQDAAAPNTSDALANDLGEQAEPVDLDSSFIATAFSDYSPPNIRLGLKQSPMNSNAAKQSGVRPDVTALVAPLRDQSLVQLKESGIFRTGSRGASRTYYLLRRHGVELDPKNPATLTHVHRVRVALSEHGDALVDAGILRR